MTTKFAVKVMIRDEVHWVAPDIGYVTAHREKRALTDTIEQADFVASHWKRATNTHQVTDVRIVAVVGWEPENPKPKSLWESIHDFMNEKVGPDWQETLMTTFVHEGR